MLKYVPNILTIFRFFLIPFIISFGLVDNYVAITIVLIISALTDILDGNIARKYNFITDFGRLVDPLADKCTLVSILLVLVLKHIIPIWILIVVTIKEILAITGATIIYKKKLVTSSKWFGKLATVLFYIAILCSILIKQFNLSYKFDIYIYYVAITMTIFSLAMYLRLYLTNKFIPTSNH